MGLDTVFIPHPINMCTYEMVIFASSGGMCSMHWDGGGEGVENCIRSIDGEARMEETTWKTRG